MKTKWLAALTLLAACAVGAPAFAQKQPVLRLALPIVKVEPGTYRTLKLSWPTIVIVSNENGRVGWHRESEPDNVRFMDEHNAIVNFSDGDYRRDDA